MAKGKTDESEKKTARVDGKAADKAKRAENGAAKKDAQKEPVKAKPDAKSDSKAKPEVKSEAKPEPPKPEPKSAAKPEPEPAAKPEPAPAQPAPAAATDVASEPYEIVPPRALELDVAPSTPAPAPGKAPRGDARSLRRGTEFCIIYRHKVHLVRRQGVVGTTGEWTVTEYPNMHAAAHAYAQECSDLRDEGFRDYR